MVLLIHREIHRPSDGIRRSIQVEEALADSRSIVRRMEGTSTIGVSRIALSSRQELINHVTGIRRQAQDAVGQTHADRNRRALDGEADRDGLRERSLRNVPNEGHSGVGGQKNECARAWIQNGITGLPTARAERTRCIALCRRAESINNRARRNVRQNRVKIVRGRVQRVRDHRKPSAEAQIDVANRVLRIDRCLRHRGGHAGDPEHSRQK